MYYVCISFHHLLRTCDNLAIVTAMHFNPAADCGAPPPPVNESLLQPHTNTTEGSVVVFQCDPGFVPVGVLTVVCGSDGQWTPNPGSITCSPRPTQTFTQTFTQVPMQASTPTQTSTPTGPGKNQLTPPCIITVRISLLMRTL